MKHALNLKLIKDIIDFTFRPTLNFMFYNKNQEITILINNGTAHGKVSNIKLLNKYFNGLMKPPSFYKQTAVYQTCL